MVEQEGRLEIVRQTIDCGADGGAGFIVFQCRIRRRAGGGNGVVRSRLVFVRRIEAYGRVAAAPAIVVVAEIGECGE